MKKTDLLERLIDASQDLEKAQARGVQATHKQLLVFTASRTITNLITDLLTEGEANEEV